MKLTSVSEAKKLKPLLLGQSGGSIRIAVLDDWSQARSNKFLRVHALARIDLAGAALIGGGHP